MKTMEEFINLGFEFHKAEERKSNIFIQIPKQFYSCPFYRKFLTSSSRELYGWLRDRMSMSEYNVEVKGKKDYIDENGYIYLVFTRKEIGEILGLSKQTVSNAFDTLNKLGLIYEKRLGQGKTNRIYIGKVKYMSEKDALKMLEDIENKGIDEKSKKSTSQKSKNQTSKISTSRSKKNRTQEVEILGSTNTNINNTNINNTKLSSSTDEISVSNNFDIEEFFENSICKLKPTTKPKFKKYVEIYDNEFIIALITYLSEIGTYSFNGFSKAMESYISKNILTKEDFELDVKKFREEKARSKTENNNLNMKLNATKGNFTNYSQRKYDFDDLERKLFEAQEKKTFNQANEKEIETFN